MQRNNLSTSNSAGTNSYQAESYYRYQPTYYYDTKEQAVSYHSGPQTSYSESQPSDPSYYSYRTATGYTVPTMGDKGYSHQSTAAYTFNNLSIDPSNPIAAALQSLQTRIYNSMQRNTYDRPRSEILNQALLSISNIQSEINNNALLLDLYITVNSIFNICSKGPDFISALKKVFGEREDILRGDSHDYCYSQTLANQFCQNVAKIVFPTSEPLNILLEKARTQNRSAPWQDVTTLDSNIEDAGSFFRTRNNCIHLYQAVVDRAIGILRRGYFELSDIWHGTDVKNLDTLSNESLNVLKQRSPTLRQLVEYTETLAVNSGYITQIFANWRKGLKDGKGSGEAGTASYLANQEFFDWWDNLSKTQEGQIIKSKISDITDLNNFINELKSKASLDHCVDGYQYELEKLLGQHRQALQKIENSCFLNDLTEYDLENIKQQISSELGRFQTIKIDSSFFSDLCKNKDFMNRFSKNSEKMTFTDVIQKPAPVITPSPKPVAPKIVNVEPAKKAVSQPQVVYQPPTTVPQQPQYNCYYPSVQKHGLFKHYRERREVKKIEKQLQKLKF